MKNYIKLIALAALLANPVWVKAEDLSIIGVAKTIGSIIFGETTVTPSYCLNTWDSYYNAWDDVSGYGMTQRQKVRFDRFFHTYSFYTSTDEGNYHYVSTDPFSISSVALQNYNCNDITFHAISGQTYTIIMTCSTVTTGLLPPTGPFDISFKTVGTFIGNSCYDADLGWTREFRKTFSVLPYGYVTGSIGHPSFSFAWPFQCWAGFVYLY